MLIFECIVVHSDTTQHTAVLTIFRLYFQTTTIAQLLVEERGVATKSFTVLTTDTTDQTKHYQITRHNNFDT